MINHNLTKREQEVLKLVAQAKTNKEIAEELYIADCTLDTHLHNIYKKLGLFATDRAQTSVLRLKTAKYYWNKKQQANRVYYHNKIKDLLAENEELKKTILQKCSNCNEEYLSPIGAKLYEENAELKAENEKLKQVANDSIIEQEKLIAKVNELQAEIERLKEEQERQRDYIVNYKNYKYEQEQKYRQALQEIRDIAGFHTSKEDSEDVQSDMQDILAKINEVIGAE